jgi:hypothetical protein
VPTRSRDEAEKEASENLTNDPASHSSKVTFTKEPGKGEVIVGSYSVMARFFSARTAKTPVLCTTFAQFKSAFGDFSQHPGQSALAHAVFDFFHNGGTRCYVMRVEKDADLMADDLFAPLDAIDEISLVCVPGCKDANVWSLVLAYCEKTHRFAILDEGSAQSGAQQPSATPRNSQYGAFYYPRIQVFDPAKKAIEPNSPGLIDVGACGHLAGIYARVDAERGVHKAPANEVVLGALGLEQPISKAVQDGLNYKGVNCIRNLNGAIRVWGARTIGGDQNGEFKYVSTRRLMLFLHRSIEQGTQWVVFEPNNRALWQKITRNLREAWLSNASEGGVESWRWRNWK